MAEPLVSVILPVYNAGRFLDDAIRSVLAQGEPSLEILAVDDGSTDDSGERLADWESREPRVRRFAIENRGPAGARNRALVEARGTFIAFIDADDLWPSGKLELQLKRLGREPDLAAVSGFTCWFDRTDESGLAPAADARRMDLFHVHLGAALFRRTALDDLGGLDERLRYSEDMDLYMRMREQRIPFVILQAVTLYYRRHLASMTGGRHTPQHLQMFEMLRYSLERRRKDGVPVDVSLFASYLDP